MGKVYVLKHKGWQDDEFEICGVFTTKENLADGKAEFIKQYPLLCENCTWDVEEYELDQFSY